MTAKAILFDFDGTLIDTWPGIEVTLKQTLIALNVPFKEGDINPSLVGIPLLKVFSDCLGLDDSDGSRAALKYRELFPRIGTLGARPFDGVPGLLEKLQVGGRQLFVVTARNEIIARKMMAEHDLARFFTGVRGELEGEVPDGKAHMVAEVLQKFNMDPDDCVMVGDRRYDIEAALRNGVHAVGVTYGYGKREELLEAGASEVVGSIEELQKMLTGEDL